MTHKPSDGSRPDASGRRDAAKKMPPAGPHAKPGLTDHEKTPGTGSLPDSDNSQPDVGPD